MPGPAETAERESTYTALVTQVALQANVVQKNLTIVISPEEAREIEAVAEPSRAPRL